MAERIRRTQKEILRDKLVKIDGEIDKASAALKRLKNERSQHEKELNDLEMGEVVDTKQQHYHTGTSEFSSRSCETKKIKILLPKQAFFVYNTTVGI